MSDETFSHLPPLVRRLAGLENKHRIARIDKPIWIEHSAARRIMDRLWDIFTQPPNTRMENILLIGESGVGKTSLIEAFKRRVKSRIQDATVYQHKNREYPFIYTLMPPEPTEKEFYNSILGSVSIPHFKRSHFGGLSSREIVLNFLQNSGTKLIIVDEINSIVAGTAAQQRILLQHLRYLSNTLEIGLVCVGTPEARYALRADDQLRRRFVEIELPIWSNGSGFRKFVDRMVLAMPLRQPSEVGEQLYELIFHRSQGVTDTIGKAVRRAAIAAIHNNREMLDLAAFQDDAVWGSVSLIETDPPYRHPAGSSEAE